MRTLLLTLLLLLLPQGGLQPVSIPISNPGKLGYGQSVTQDLGVSPEQLQAIPTHLHYYYEGVYVLSFSVKDALGDYPGYYTAEIDFGSQELCEMSGWGKVLPAQVTLVCPASNYIAFARTLPGGGPPQGTSDLTVTWTVNDGSTDGGWPIVFDNVSLTYTPEVP